MVSMSAFYPQCRRPVRVLSLGHCKLEEVMSAVLTNPVAITKLAHHFGKPMAEVGVRDLMIGSCRHRCEPEDVRSRALDQLPHGPSMSRPRMWGYFKRCLRCRVGKPRTAAHLLMRIAPAPARAELWSINPASKSIRGRTWKELSTRRPGRCRWCELQRVLQARQRGRAALFKPRGRPSSVRVIDLDPRTHRTTTTAHVRARVEAGQLYGYRAQARSCPRKAYGSTPVRFFCWIPMRSA